MLDEHKGVHKVVVEVVPEILRRGVRQDIQSRTALQGGARQLVQIPAICTIGAR